jgi:hypothetical protein
MRLIARRTATTPAMQKRPTRQWSPAQLVALILGGVSVAFGVLALTRTGLDLSHLTRDHDSFLGFGHTPLLGLAEIGFGVLMLFAALGPVAGRNVMSLLGAAAVGLGIVIIAGWWSAKMTRWLGVGDRNGWLFIAVGGVALFAAFFAPVWTTGGPRIVQEPVVTDTAADTPAADPPADETTPAAAPAPPRGERRIRLPRLGRHERPRVPEPPNP